MKHADIHINGDMVWAKLKKKIYLNIEMCVERSIEGQVKNKILSPWQCTRERFRGTIYETG